MKFVDEVITATNTKNKNSKHSSGGIFVVKSRGIASGINLVAEILKKNNPKNILYVIKKDGDFINRGDGLISVRGNYNDIIKVKDTCQNLFSLTCGVSSTILKYLNEIRDLDVKLLFQENMIPGIGEYWNEAIINSGCSIINHKDVYLDKNIWESEEEIHQILSEIDDDNIYVEVSNLVEFNALTISKCTHIVCVDFTLADLEYVVENKNNKIIIAKNNMTFAGIRAIANKQIDYIIIKDFYSQMKFFDVEFKYFQN